MEIKLGTKVRDKVSGFVGIATARVQYLNGCVQYCVRPRVGHDNKVIDPEYIDVQQLEIVEEGTLTYELPSEMTGGPQRDCPR